MPPDKTPPPSSSRHTNISVGGDVNGNVIVGDNNTVNQTIVQKFFNIFKSDAETVDQRNRRIMLGHVENFWVKGILEKSLHGAALLDLGIKEDPDALNYPWAIKREANKEILPAGTSMLEIFQEVGLGRSLLILGAPGSGKTTMLLELTRQLIERAREDVTEPIPVVFNLSSWTEKLSLADWLARELNLIYTIPKKIAPTWVKENKMLLLLDGLDEVRQESRDKCVDAINQFRKENGLTSVAVCSRIQDYAELKTRLSFDGAIEIQPLTTDQVGEYFQRFGKGLAGIRMVLEKNAVLREIAETPLFLSIMTLAYLDTQRKDILIAEYFDIQLNLLFDTYIARMFERPRSKKLVLKKQDILRWLSWLAKKMIEHNAVPYMLENMQPEWLSQKQQKIYSRRNKWPLGLLFFERSGRPRKIEMIDTLIWDWKQVIKGSILGLIIGTIIGLIIALSYGLAFIISPAILSAESKRSLLLFCVQFSGLIGGLIGGQIKGLRARPIRKTAYPGQIILYSRRNFFIALLSWALFGMIIGLIDIGLSQRLNWPLFISYGEIGLLIGLPIGIKIGGRAIYQHYFVRNILRQDKILPTRHLVQLLDHCVDLIFLRRVGGGYIFVHRLLMEHFAAMYYEQK